MLLSVWYNIVNFIEGIEYIICHFKIKLKLSLVKYYVSDKLLN